MIEWLAQVSPTTIFTPVSEFSVSAEIGSFQPSLASTWNQTVTSFFFSTQVPSLSIEPLRTTTLNPVAKACYGSDCVSYFYSGGVASISPYIYLVPQSPDADTFIIQGEVGLQGDYWNISQAEQPFTSDHCQIWGDSDIAFSVCIKQSSLDQNNLIAGASPMVPKLMLSHGTLSFHSDEFVPN